jgi:RNA polymerase sigma-70 factor (ECF subfamily)
MNGPVRKESVGGDRSPVVRELHPQRRARPLAATAQPQASLEDADLVAALWAGDASAPATLFDRYGAQVERLLWSLLGPEAEADDLLHEVFLRALEGVHDVEEPSRLRSWVTGIAVFTAREHIRKRTRRRWLFFVDDVPERPAPAPTEEISEATWQTFEVLRSMDADERVIFSLRFIEGMEMAEVAVACDLSLSTAKRRLKDAEKHFVARARRYPALRSWIVEGGRWPA